MATKSTNGRSSGSNTWSYVRTICLAIFCWDMLGYSRKHRPKKIGHTYMESVPPFFSVPVAWPLNQPGYSWMIFPAGSTKIHHAIHGKIHDISMVIFQFVMLNYQRVYQYIPVRSHYAVQICFMVKSPISPPNIPMVNFRKKHPAIHQLCPWETTLCVGEPACCCSGHRFPCWKMWSGVREIPGTSQDFFGWKSACNHLQ